MLDAQVIHTRQAARRLHAAFKALRDARRVPRRSTSKVDYNRLSDAAYYGITIQTPWSSNGSWSRLPPMCWLDMHVNVLRIACCPSR